MRAAADFTTQPGENGACTLKLSGPLLISTLGALEPRLRAVDTHVSVIDMCDVDTIDTVGAWVAWRLAQHHDARIVNCNEDTERLIAAISKSEDAAPAPGLPPLPWYGRVAATVGATVMHFGRGSVMVIGFLGLVIASIGATIRSPRRFRSTALIRQMQLVGVDSLGIIGLMSFLIGIVIAQQGAEQLQQFGAEIYTINLTGRLSMRELGVLMTAIMVAGRSGSAFAAQLGTMKLTEEVDAMRTIGVSPAEALVLPRILAAVLMMPLLGVYSAVMAIIGGAFVSALSLGIPFFTFLTRVQDVVPSHDLWVSLIKALVFGLIIGIAGCYQGLQVENNAEEVGTRTTSAVVMAIFMVIVLDAFFAVFFSNVGWG